MVLSYYTGYVLLVFGTESKIHWRRSVGIMPAVNVAVVCLMWLAALAFPVCIPSVAATADTENMPNAAQFGRELAKNLPSQPAIVLSDDPNLLYLAMNAVRESRFGNQYAFVATLTLMHGDYLRYLVARYPILGKEILAEKFPR